MRSKSCNRMENPFGLQNGDMAYIVSVVGEFAEIEKVVVFGSRAKGTHKKGSDIDLAIFGNDVSFSTLARLHYRLEEEGPLPYFFDIVDYTHSDHQELKAHIERVGKIIFDREGLRMLDLRNLKQALEALGIAFKIYDQNLLPEHMPEKVVLRDGVIQRFEFTFELAWKTLKRYLQEYGLENVDSLNNRDLFRVGFEQGLLDDPEVWFHYLKMRNQSSHLYDEGKAALVFASARRFQQDAQALIKKLGEKIQ